MAEYEWYEAEALLPGLSDYDFRKKRADYVAKYGYRVSFPWPGQVFHLGLDNPITELEEKLWKQKKYREIGLARSEEIKQMKFRRRELYLDILGSPTPEILEARASILTALDDLQDAIFTLAVVGVVAATVLTGGAAGAIATGAGWLLAGSAGLNIITTAITPERKLISKKRAVDAVTKENPFTKKAMAKQVNNLLSAKMIVPIALQALQTTDQMFGVGISLGAVMNLPFAAASGVVKYITGDAVTVTVPYLGTHTFQREAAITGQSLGVLSSFGYGTDDEFITSLYVAANFCMQAQQSICRGYNPLFLTKDVGNLIVEAPRPHSVLVREILEEIDPRGIDKVAWPATGKRFNTYNELSKEIAPIATQNLRDYSQRQKNSLMGLTGAMNASAAGQHAIQALEGPGTLRYDYTEPTKSLHTMLDNGYIPPDNLTEPQKTCFLNWLDEHERFHSHPTAPEILAYVKFNCGWQFVRF